MCMRSLVFLMGISLLFSLPLDATRVKQVVRRTADAYEKHEADLQRMRQVQAAGVAKPARVRVVKRVKPVEVDLESEVSSESVVKPNKYHVDVCRRYISYCKAMSNIRDDDAFLTHKSYEACERLTNGSDATYKLGTLNLFAERIQSYLDKKIYN